jgi:hypothetical protein
MIVGLVGFIGSGKGTVADIMTTEHGFSKESFAGGVKDAASVIFGWDRKLLEGDTEESRAWRETPDEYWSEKLGYSHEGISLIIQKAIQKMRVYGGIKCLTSSRKKRKSCK